MKRRLTILLITGLLASSMMAQQSEQSKDMPLSDSLSINASTLADNIIEDAYRYLGAPYAYGSGGPHSFDCSGFSSFIYSHFGYNLSHSSSEQALDGRAVHGDLSDLQKGDIVVFSGRGARGIGHVGIYIEPDPSGDSFRFIHAARGGVQISHLDEPYYKQRFKGARRIIPDILSTPLPVAENPYPFEIDTLTAIQKDTLRLDSMDKRIILFSNGRWAYVDSTGTLSVPQEKKHFILSDDGSWKFVEEEKATSPALPQPTAQKVATVHQAQYHTVKSGDTLTKIAARYHTTVNALCRQNNLKTTSVLRIGQKIKVS